MVRAERIATHVYSCYGIRPIEGW